MDIMGSTSETKPLNTEEESKGDSQETIDNSDNSPWLRWIVIFTLLTFLLIALLAITMILLMLMYMLSSQYQNIALNNSSDSPTSLNLASFHDSVELVHDSKTSKPQVENTEEVPKKQSLRLVEAPKNRKVVLGDNVELICIFSEPVQCSWERSEQTVSITERYNYKSSKNSDGESTDCSIIITNVSPIDFGKWTCEMKSRDNQDNEIPSADAYISEVKEDPHKKFAKLGANVDLECTFQDATDCMWLRDGISVDINGRYQYQYAQGRSTTNCRVTISKITENDYGNWTCVSPGNSNRSKQILKDPITLLKAI